MSDPKWNNETIRRVLAHVGKDITEKLNEISRLLNPDVRLTLIIRNPVHPEAEPAVMTNEDDGVDPEPLIKALRGINGTPDGKIMDFHPGMPGKERIKQ